MYSTQNRFYRWLVSACAVRAIGHVAEEEDDNDTCVSEVLQSKAVGVIFKKLSGFSEYNVTVTSYLDHFNQSDSSFKLGRTRNFSSSHFKVCLRSHLLLFLVPDQDYNWTVTLAGELQVTWLRKFSMFQEDNPVDISWLQTPGTIGGSNNGTARISIVPGLRLGAAYTVTEHSTRVHRKHKPVFQVTMMDLASEDALLTFSFTACKLFKWPLGTVLTF